MKEFKFWASPFSYKQLLLFAIPIWIIGALSFFYIDMEKHFHYLFIFMIFWFVFIVPVFLIKRVKVILSEDNVQIYYYGRLKYSGNINTLEYIRGTDIDNGKGYTNVRFVFSDKQYVFTIMESNGAFAPPVSKQGQLLSEFVETYNLRKEFYKAVFMNNIYTYYNSSYNPSMTSGYNRKEK